MDYSNSLRPAFLASTASQLLKEPVTALLTVSEDAAKALSNIGILSIFDLGSSQLFSAARQIKEASQVNDTELIQRFSGDLIDTVAFGKKSVEIADSSISVLRQLDDTSAALIQTALSVLQFGSWRHGQPIILQGLLLIMLMVYRKLLLLMMKKGRMS